MFNSTETRRLETETRRLETDTHTNRRQDECDEPYLLKNYLFLSGEQSTIH